MATLIDITYPDLMREFADPQRIAVCLERDRAHDFSFLVLQGDENGQARYTAGCLAFMETSKVNPERPDPVLYLDDMAVLPEARTALGGVRAFRELLVRTGEIDSFELRARVGGSYNAFRKGETRDTAMSGVLRAAGWTAVDHGPARTFGSGAEQIVLNLITVKRTGDPKAT